MSKLNHWLKQQQNSNQRFVSLQDLFFSQKKNAYLLYRVKLFNLQYLIHYAFFCTFYVSNYRGMSSRSFSIVALLYLVQKVMINFWWGAIETMRTQVRYDKDAHKTIELELCIGNYLLLSLILAILLLLVNYWVGSLYIESTNPDFLVQHFILFFSICLPILLVVKTFHSGIYAITRVIRTPLSIITPDLLGLISLLLLYPMISLQASLYAMIVQSLAGLILQLKFVSRMYRFYDVWPKLPTARQFIRWLKTFPILEFFIAGLSFVFIHADIVLIAIFTFFMQTGMISNQLFAVLFLIHPPITASTEWAILFYFDRKHIRLNDFKKMMTFYDISIGKAASAFAFFYWFIAFMATLLIISPEATLSLIVLLPFFIVKSKLANLEVKAFSYNYYLKLLFVNAWFLFVCAMLFFMGIPLLYDYLIVLTAIVVGIKLLQKPLFKKIRRPIIYKLPITFFSFLHCLNEPSELPLTVYYLSFISSIQQHQKFYILGMIASNFLRNTEELCVISESECVFFTKNRTIHRSDIFSVCSGLIQLIEKKEFFCLEHLRHLALNRIGIFAKLLPPLPEKLLSTNEIKKLFFNLFPKGIYFFPEPELGPEAKRMPIEDSRELYMKAFNYLFYIQDPRSTAYNIDLYHLNNQIEGIFAIPNREYSEQRIQYWHSFLLAQNLWGCITLSGQS